MITSYIPQNGEDMKMKTKKDSKYILIAFLPLLTPLAVMMLLENHSSLITLIGLWALFTIPIYLMLLAFTWSARVEIKSNRIILNALFVFKEFPFETILSYEITKGGTSLFSLFDKDAADTRKKRSTPIYAVLLIKISTAFPFSGI